MLQDLVNVLDTPPLPGAACAGQHGLFDAAARDADARTQALAVCARCPVLARCADALAAQRWPAGTVVAGAVVSSTAPPISAAVKARRAERKAERRRARALERVKPNRAARRAG